MNQLPRDFWLLCLSTLLFVLSFNLILPELNDFMVSFGEGDRKWVVLVAWTITAMLLRPISGKMTDVVGRKFVIHIGIIVSFIAAFFYPLSTSLSLFFFVRLFHGVSVGFQPTGASALAADLIPEKMRGEAMGIFSISISLGFGTGQILSQPLKEILGLNGLFYSVAFFSALAFILMIPIKETQQRRSDFHIRDILPKPNEIISNEVYVPTIIMFLITLCTGFYILLIPDIATHLNIENKGSFFFMHMLSSLIVRYLAGRLSDRIGRKKSLIMGISVFAIATFMMLGVETIFGFLFCGFVYGIGTGIISPTIMAWTTDLSHPDRKGRGLSTMWMGLEFGVMVGAFLGMYLYANNVRNFDLIFLIAALILIAIVLYLLLFGKKIPEKYVNQPANSLQIDA